jgi:hypothetical protein
VSGLLKPWSQTERISGNPVSDAEGLSINTERAKMKNLLKKGAVSALLGMSAVALLSTTASAAIACNGEGECWHVKKAYTYHPDFGVVVHPDNWRWGPNEHYVWREHEGRGYWRGGVWIKF